MLFLQKITLIAEWLEENVVIGKELIYLSNSEYVPCEIKFATFIHSFFATFYQQDQIASGLFLLPYLFYPLPTKQSTNISHIYSTPISKESSERRASCSCDGMKTAKQGQ